MSETGKPLVERYRPTTFDEIQGHGKALDAIEEHVRSWSPGDKGILLYGPPGTGKTTTAEVIANELDVPFNEMNTSSMRGKEDVKEMAEQINSGVMGAKFGVILLDEVDSWHHGTSLSPLKKALDDPQNLVVLSANDLYDVPSSLKSESRVKTYEFKLGKRSIRSYVRKVAEEEGIELTSQQLNRLSERPDIRSALQDLQQFQGGYDIGPASRGTEQNDFAAIQDFFIGDTDGVEEMKPPDEVLWIFHNLAEEYDGIAAGVSFDALARADVALGRAADQDYRHWKYASKIMELVAHLRLSDTPKRHWVDVNFPEFYRHKTVKPDKDTPEARVYRKLKDHDGSYRFSANYTEFLKTILPMLKDLPEETRMELALAYGLDPSDGEVEVLDLSPSEYEEWREGDGASEGKWEPEAGDALEW